MVATYLDDVDSDTDPDTEIDHRFIPPIRAIPLAAFME
jgi:hypothetical protein